MTISVLLQGGLETVQLLLQTFPIPRIARDLTVALPSRCPHLAPVILSMASILEDVGEVLKYDLSVPRFYSARHGAVD